MKVKTLIACAVTATALPFASAFAQNNAEPSGPQGTGWYGAPNAAYPAPQDNGAYGYDASRNAVPQSERRDVRMMPWRTDRTNERPARTQRWVYQGFSADTNPPAPTY